MTTRHLINNKEKIIAGLNKTADVVKSTMGAKGKTVIIASDDEKEILRFTKDGVSVAKSIKLDDPIENIGAQILISATKKTVELCGDGTTLTAVLLQALVNEITKYINDKGNIDINKLMKDLDDSVALVIEYILDKTNKVTDLFHIKSIASVSANSIEIGNLFEKIYSETGFDAKIGLEKSEAKEYTYFEVLKGITFDSNTGYAHPAFMTNKDTEQAIYENAYVHIDYDPITRLTEDYDKLLGDAAKKNIPLIIIAPKFSDSFIRTCVMHKVNSGYSICLIKAPGYGGGMKKNFEDISAFLDENGFVDKVVIDDFKFTLYNDDTPFLEDRLKSLTSLKEHAVEWYEQDDLNNRIYKLRGATAVIYAGGTTPEQQSEEYDRLEDAIGAVNSAVESGYVEGGGLTLMKATLDTKLHKIVKNVCMTPLMQIISNANVNINIDTENIKGYNVSTMQYEDFLESGIIDPTSVLIVALQNALANAKLLLNTDYILYNQYETKNKI